MASLKDIRGRISSVKNIRKITRAMEMVAAARLRRAEQRIEHLRPYADAIRRMTARASQAAENIPSLPILEEKESVQTVGLRPVTGARGLAGPSNSQICRAGTRRAAELRSDGKQVLWYVSGRRGLSSLEFRKLEVGGSWTGFTDRPAFADARAIADGLTFAYVDDKVEISIYRALLESTASEHGARMSAMRSASDNAADIIDDLTLEANRQRQAEITQAIMEVVAGAEGLR